MKGEAFKDIPTPQGYRILDFGCPPRLDERLRTAILFGKAALELHRPSYQLD